MKKESAGLLMYRFRDSTIEILLVHPGGPFWAKKDEGAWSIPKGEIDEGEEPLLAARREFQEELSIEAVGPFSPLGTVRQKSGKIVHAWCFEGDCDPLSIKSNIISIEWPPRSGRQMEIPEVDRAGFFTVREAALKLNPAQFELVKELERYFPEQYKNSIEAKNREMLFDF